MMKTTVISSVIVWVAAWAVPALANSIVYLGTDPSVHYSSFAQATALAGNVARLAGGNINPKIAYVEADPGFGGNVNGVLTAAGLTQLTQFTPAGLAAANLNLFDVVYIGASTIASAFIPAAANVQSFVNGGGGLIAEAEVHDPASWTWLPYANLIGHSGTSNVSHEAVNIAAPLHPAMAGLTSTGLSNWDFSVHSTFTTPGLAGFTTLSSDFLNGRAHIIVLQVPEANAFALGVLAFGFTALGSARTRRLPFKNQHAVTLSSASF
jgi:hypothetical protein